MKVVAENIGKHALGWLDMVTSSHPYLGDKLECMYGISFYKALEHLKPEQGKVFIVAGSLERHSQDYEDFRRRLKDYQHQGLDVNVLIGSDMESRLEDITQRATSVGVLLKPETAQFAFSESPRQILCRIDENSNFSYFTPKPFDNVYSQFEDIFEELQKNQR